MIDSNDKAIIEKKINNLKKKYNLSVSYEVKWSKVTKRLLKLYMEILTCIFLLILNLDVFV